MTWFDGFVLAVIASSCLLSLVRGLLSEVASVAVWSLAVVLGWQLGPIVAESLPAMIPTDRLRFGLGFFFVFIVVVFCGRFFALALREAVVAAGASPIDRALGVLFGLVRGVLMVLVVGFLIMMTRLPEQPFWRNSSSAEAIASAIARVAPWLPEKFAELVRPNLPSQAQDVLKRPDRPTGVR